MTWPLTATVSPEQLGLAAVGEPDARGQVRPDRRRDAPVIRG